MTKAPRGCIYMQELTRKEQVRNHLGHGVTDGLHEIRHLQTGHSPTQKDWRLAIMFELCFVKTAGRA